MMNTTIGILLPFVGTALGAAMVFLLRNEISPRLQKLLLGFASGVMMAASVWSLLLPSIDIATEQGMIAWLPAAAGFVGGMFFLLLLHYYLYNLLKYYFFLFLYFQIELLICHPQKHNIS